MKIGWRATHSGELTKFRAEIHAHCSALSVLLGKSNVTLTKVYGERILAGLANTDATVRASSEEPKHLLEQMKAKLDENDKQTRAGNAIASKIWGALRPDWYRRLGQELQSSMKKIYMMNMSTYNAVINIQERLLSHLE